MVLQNLDVSLDVDRVINRVQVVCYPVETVGAAQVIWTARTVLKIPAGGTRTVNAPFRNANGDRCGAIGVVPPVATTDYTVNERADGTGWNYTTGGVFALTVTIEATRAVLQMSNSAIGDLYVTFLRVRGQPLQTYDPVVFDEEDTISQDAYEMRARVLDLPMLSDLTFGRSYAEFLVGRFSAPRLKANRAVLVDEDTVDGVNLFTGLELLSMVAVTDAQTGLSGKHEITAIEYHLSAGRFEVAFDLELIDDLHYCRLDRVGYCELDSGVKVGF